MRALLLAIAACSAAPAHPATCTDTQRADSERDRFLANERVRDPRLFECDDRNCRLGELCIAHAASALDACGTQPRGGSCYSLPPACHDEPTCACATHELADRVAEATLETCTDVGGHVTFVER